MGKSTPPLQRNTSSCWEDDTPGTGRTETLHEGNSGGGGMFQKLGRTTERLEDRTSENDILVFKMWKKLDSVTLFLSKSL